MTITTELIIGGATILGTAIVALVKLGLITFGRPVPPTDRRKCPAQLLDAFNNTCGDHKAVVAAIKSHEEGSKRREAKIDKLINKIEYLSGEVSKISGFLQGKEGYHQ